MKSQYCLGLVLAVVAAGQVVACSSEFRSCGDTLTCAAVGGGGADNTGGVGGNAASAEAGGGAKPADENTGGLETAGGAGIGAVGIGGEGGGSSGGEGGAAGNDGAVGSTDGTAIGTLNQPCTPEGAYACAGHAQKGQLICSGGKWVANGTCASGNNCDSTPGANAGSCAPILAQCSAAGDAFCASGIAESCGVDLVTLTKTTCTGTTPVCLGGACVACSPNAVQCFDGSHTETCSATGSWEAATACSGGFCNGAGICGVCKAGSKRCTASGPETCSANGTWSNPTATCTGATPVCDPTTFACVPRPSCTGLAATCGPSSSGDCCASSVVPAGSFYRGYDGTNFTSTAYPATVSDFRLDTYEITVGRFRKFAAAFKQTMIAQGAGKNPNDAADTGWSTTWNTHLDASAAALTSALECGTYATWTDTVGAAAHESQPLNCLNWFEAEAFCIWDGGRLPTEAEWNYAASAGSEQRVFPWGNTTPGPNSSLEIYGCYFSGLPTCTGSTDIAPVGLITGGNGKWGQADLAGNVEEWVRDAYGAYPLPCTNCSAGPSQVEAVLRGGSFFTDVTTTYASARDEADPGTHYLTYGARCARNP